MLIRSRFALWSLSLLLACGSPQPKPEPEVRLSAHALLAGIVIEEPDPSIGATYNRKDWKHWIDADGDCQNTRVEVLQRDAAEFQLDRSGCRIVRGVWHDPYTGKTFTDKGDIDIDHLVPLKEAYVSGGYRWSAERKEAYANFLENSYHLIAVEDKANQQKSDHSPDEWMPANASYACTYVRNWSRVKQQWKLTMTRREYAFVNAKLVECDAHLPP